ncbi:hypothetical protein [Methylococcus sp. EFPC2]|uniref:hypothetical protein n=1 Tax=Methylococcus sp. EFPC2 TaxID=2812648 RepID=UPI0019688DAA|nr:hypothetical protein [Methylococcus sp. EFPC2]QSA98489.1 hypothetical protein JWZ97_06700 [Methylococcus sp. EFPC2]
MSTLEVTIDDKTQAALSNVASLTHQSIDAVVRRAIDAYLLRELEHAEDDKRFQGCIEHGGIEGDRVLNWLDDWNKGNRKACPE